MISIILCDDHALMVDGLEALIGHFDDCAVVCKASSGLEVIEYLEHNVSPDIIMMDIRMPNGISGFELAMYLNEHYPDLKMIVCTGLLEKAAVIEMYVKGARGFVSKDCVASELKEAIIEVYHGNLHFKESFLSGKGNPDFKLHKKSKIINNLTEHELDIARLMASNKPYKQIADDMSITINSLENIRIRIFQKLKVQTRIEVAIYLLNMGLV